MKLRRIIFSDAAVVDVLEQSDWYADKTSDRLAERWESAVSSTLMAIAAQPASGSLCGFRAPELDGTRRMLIEGFPKHLIFYQSNASEVLILRIVHGARDLESLFEDRSAATRAR